jgi:CDP-glycerol glycerophosphotransferase
MVPYEETAPGPWVSNSEEIIASLRDLTSVQASHEFARKEFVRRYLPLEDGHATERLIAEVFRSEQIS